MKTIGIITITDNNNYGNRLQNFAVEYFLNCNNINVKTIWKKDSWKRKIKNKMCDIFFFIPYCRRYNHFRFFTDNYTNVYVVDDYNIIDSSLFDFYVFGSDQIWNLKWQLEKNLPILKLNKKQVISFSASFGVNNIDNSQQKKYCEILQNINYISVREDRGKEIVEKLTGRTDVEVLIDPTMLLTSNQWDKVSKKPKKFKSKKYILNYFLGELSDQRKQEIDRIAKENGCDVINILDKNDPLYVSGPSEFLWLEKNAFLICTDSFHSSVFAILYDKPFIIFDREDNEEKMNSRIETLLSKFQLKNREYNGVQITEENLKHDYSVAYEILEKEQLKSKKFLCKALDIEQL